MRSYLLLFMIRRVVFMAIGFLMVSPAAGADTIYVANYFSGALTKFDSGGTGAAFGTTRIAGTYGLTCDSAGNLYVGMILGPIEKWDSAGNESVFTSLNKNVGDLAVDSANNVYAINTGNASMGVQEFSPAGVLLRTVTPGSISAPRGLAVDATGNIFLGCHFAGSSVIEKITPTGTITIFATLVSPVLGLTFDLTGNLFVTSGSSIYEYAPNGNRTIIVPRGLTTPQGLAFDSAGNLFVVTGGNTIQEITPTGTMSTFATATSIQDIALARSGPPVVAATDTPALPTWALILLAGLLLVVAGRGTLIPRK